jgi:hypothetical protein
VYSCKTQCAANGIVLGKQCDAANVHLRPRPAELTGLFALSVAIFQQAPACLQNSALIANQPVSQRSHKLTQRVPGLLVQVFAGDVEGGYAAAFGTVRSLHELVQVRQWPGNNFQFFRFVADQLFGVEVARQ